VVDFVMALETNRQEKLNLVQPIPESSPPMVNLTRHLAPTYLADWIVAEKLFPHITIDFVLAFSLGRHSA
jgi:hypothetical protein